MVIQSDTRQKRKHHDAKEKYFREQGYTVVQSKMLVGDYCFPSNGSICVDTKADMKEVYQNLVQSHERFRRECDLAVQAGIKLYVLVENTDGIKCIDDVLNWHNPQLARYIRKRNYAKKNGLPFSQRPPVSNQQLLKMMHSMESKHGVKFVFCLPRQAGKTVIDLLEGKYEEVRNNEQCN